MSTVNCQLLTDLYFYTMQKAIALILITISFFTLFSCNEDDTAEDGGNMFVKLEEGYMQDLYTLGVPDLYREQKWRLYCNYCDQQVVDCKGIPMKNLTYGMLDLRAFHLKTEGDTCELAYTFLLHDSLQCGIDNVPGNKIHGVAFLKKSEKPIYYISAGSDEKIPVTCDSTTAPGMCPTRMIEPLQPEVVRYINKVSATNKLNPWFHMEAVKRGVIKE